MNKDNSYILFDICEDIEPSLIPRLIRALSEAPNDCSLLVAINSYGGCPYTAFGLYNILRAHKGLVVTWNAGACFSAATVPFCAGDMRMAIPEASFMIHEITDSQEAPGSVLASNSAECLDVFRRMCKLYAANTKKSYRFWLNKKSDYFFNVEQALDFGFLDQIQKEEPK